MEKPLEFSDRLSKLPPYLFLEIDRAKRKALESGKDIIDMGIGDPDLPTPAPIIDALNAASRDPKNHRYALDSGLPEFRRAIAHWYQNRFGVVLDPDREILPLIGSKEGIGHFPLAFVNPGDCVLVPEPGYPVYQSSTWFAGGECVYMSLLEENHYLPDFQQIPASILPRVKMMFLNYPNNPTGATASRDFFEKAIRFADHHQIILCHDAAYTEIYYDERPHSLLEFEGGKEIGVEFHSLSKTYNMTGWRIGFAVGNAKFIQGLAKIKSNLDSGIFYAIQWAGVRALQMTDGDRRGLLDTYRERRDVLVEGLKRAGWKIQNPKASFYVWTRIPERSDSKAFALRLLDETGIIATPGIGFGKSGEGYIRFSLTLPVTRIREAITRLNKFACT